MNKSREFRTGFRVITTAAAVLAAQATVSVPAVASAPPSERDNACSEKFIPSNTDPGGYGAKAWWNDETSCSGWWYNDMSVSFDPYDEVLKIWVDNWNEDITDVYAYMRVYEKGGSRVIDYDKFTYEVDAGNTDWKQVGTPDGSGNIEEGHFVQIKICGRPHNGETQCSDWAFGVA